MTSARHALSPERHFAQMAAWLDLESIAERQRMAARRQRRDAKDQEASGETLLDLVIEDHQVGVGGLFLLTLVKRRRHELLPWNRLRVGSPVVLSADQEEGESWTGVVSQRTANSIQVAVDEWPDGDVWRIDMSPDEQTRRRQLAAMNDALEARGRLGELRRVLLGQKMPAFVPRRPVELTQRINASQREAIEFALSAEDVAIIHGPPGTGKTTTVVELIRQIVLRDQKVLACAPSNTAVDNLLERLVEIGLRAVRLGHPARVTECLREHSLDALVQNHPNQRVIHDLMRAAEESMRKASRTTRARPARGARQQARFAARELRKEARRLEDQAIRHILTGADVVCVTNSVDDELLGNCHFDWLIIDEACQSTEPGCWVPLRHADRVILAGDHCQLPPTVLSAQAAAEGLERSLLQRLVETYGERITRQLEEQYRMHEQIMRFSSNHFYQDRLVAHPTVAAHRLSDLAHVSIDAPLDEPVLFLDTAGADWLEELEPDGESKLNRQEARLVMLKVQQLLAAGIPPRDVGVIAPYAAQVRLLRQMAQQPELEVDTVDGFQGREKEAMVISLVRSNREGEIGFLSDTRRMNVALTRARRKLIVIGDSATLGGHPFYAALLEYFAMLGAHHSVWEETDAM